MKTYKATFVGRRVLAIGITHRVETEVNGIDPEDARLNLYDRYEHISNLELTEVKEDQHDRRSN